MKVQLVPMVVGDGQKSQRVTRSPFNPFYIASRPMQITPCGIHPVLANETLTNMKFEARMVTDPLASPLSGGALEFYCFYVKLTDLVSIDDAVKAMITTPLTPYTNATASNAAWYHNGGGVNWTKLCYDRIVEVYFRTEQESASTAVVGDYALASIKSPHTGAFGSIAEAANYTGLSDLGDQTTSEALDLALESYDQLKDNGLINMSYEDYLRMVGIRVNREANHEPELLWSTRKWSYPTNTVDPATGVPTTAMSFVMENATKSRKLFKEWGFLVLLSVFRPKFFRANQNGAVAHFFDRGVSWIPSILNQNPATSIRLFTDAATDGPLGTSQATGYGLDMADLLHYGDQFTNLSLASASGRNLATLPLDATEARYVTTTDMDAIFSGASKTWRCDGYWKPSMLSNVGPDQTGQNLSLMNLTA